MANNCYNLISFLGNKKVKEQVKAWNLELRKFEPTEEDPHCFRAIRAVFYPDVNPQDDLDLGSKWVHLDDESIDSADDQLGLLSAWTNPSKLQERLACLLYSLDKNVVIRNSFDGEDYSSGVSYTAAFNETAAYTQTAHVELDQDEFDDIEEAEEDRDLRLSRDEIDTLTDYFLDDMPHLAKVIKKHLPHLDIDWDQFK